MGKRHGLLLARDQHHLGRRPAQRCVRETVIRLLNDQSVIGEQLSESRSGVKPDAMLPGAAPISARPCRSHGQLPRQCVERSLLREHGLIGRPPIASEKPRHDAVTTAAVPYQDSTRFEHARELFDDPRVIRRMAEESKRGEQVQNSVEAFAPFARQFPHVAARVAKIGAGSPLTGYRKQLGRVVESIDIVASLRQQMRVATLPTGDVENARRDRQLEQVEQARDLAPVTFGSEERLVLEEIVGVERGFPPLAALFQKNTGSR